MTIQDLDSTNLDGGPGSGPQGGGHSHLTVHEGGRGMNPAQHQFPHIAHLLNSTNPHDMHVLHHGISKAQAHEHAKALRSKGVFASVFKDPQGSRGKSHMVVGPKQDNMDGDPMSESVNRFDYYPMGKAQRLDNGFLKAPVTATRTGVFKYRMADGTERRELRPPDEVFNQASMDSLKGVPFTNRHPTELVNSKNAKKYMVGYTSDSVRREQNYLQTDVTITDDATIGEIDKLGLREVSCGYNCELEPKTGVFDGERYDFVQRKIRYNHLAAVDRGRAGPSVRLHLDGQDGECVSDGDGSSRAAEDINPVKEDQGMAKIKLNDVEFDASEVLASAVSTHLKNVDADLAKAKKASDDKDEKMKAMEQDADKMKAKCDSLTSELATAKAVTVTDADIAVRVSARRKLEDVAKTKLDAETAKKLDSMSDRDLKIAVIAADAKDFKADGKSDVYIDARFDHIAESANAPKTQTKLDAALSNLDASRGDAPKSADDVRAARMKMDSEAWKTPLGVAKLDSQKVN